MGVLFTLLYFSVQSNPKAFVAVVEVRNVSGRAQANVKFHFYAFVGSTEAYTIQRFFLYQHGMINEGFFHFYSQIADTLNSTGQFHQKKRERLYFSGVYL